MAKHAHLKMVRGAVEVGEQEDGSDQIVTYLTAMLRQLLANCNMESLKFYKY